jgi:acetaldehyde dehydrogenase
MADTTKRGAAILGSGHIGTDLLLKMMRLSGSLEPLLFVGIDAGSDGLQRAARLGVETSAAGLQGLLSNPRLDDIAVVFDATSSRAHQDAAPALRARGKKVVDLTPAAVGPYVVPVVNLREDDSGAALLAEPNLNMVTCGGQATIPMVHAVARAVGKERLLAAEIVASIASKSAGPGTRANIDEFTQTTARAICSVGGAQSGKAIIVLNPAEPPVIMRDTVICFVKDAVADDGSHVLDGDGVDEAALTESIEQMVADVRAYVPGYRLLKPPVLDRLRGAQALRRPGQPAVAGTKVTIFLEVEGAGFWLPKYAGNLDIMTSAALRVGERLAAR